MDVFHKLCFLGLVVSLFSMYQFRGRVSVSRTCISFEDVYQCRGRLSVSRTCINFENVYLKIKEAHYLLDGAMYLMTFAVKTRDTTRTDTARTPSCLRSLAAETRKEMPLCVV